MSSRPVPKRWRGVPRLPGSQEPGLKSARSRTGVTLESGKSGDPTTCLRIRPEKNFELGKSVLFVHFIIGRSVPKRWRGALGFRAHKNPGAKSTRFCLGVTLESGKPGEPTPRLGIRPVSP